MTRFLLSIAIAGALTGHGPDPVTLKFNAPIGQKLTFTREGSIDMDGSHQVSIKVEDTVKSVDAKGMVTVETKTVDRTIDGQSFPDQSDPVALVYKPTGELSSITSDNGPGAQVIELFAFYFPTTPVKEGDTWSFDGKPDASVEGGAPFHGEFKVLGTEKVGKYDTIKVDGQLKETGAETVKSHNVYWVSVTDGFLAKETSDFSNIPYGANAMTMSGNFTLTRTN